MILLFGTVYTQAQPPANDNCADAEPVGNVTNLPFDTTEATHDGTGGCMSSPNIWYCYTAPSSGSVIVSLCGSSYDTMVAVYNGCSCDPLGANIACNDDYCGLSSQVTFDATEGNTYLIEVGGWSSSTGLGVLSISIQGDWKADANARIELYRKGNFRITTVWTGGLTPVPDVNVQISQIKHHFAFGSCLAYSPLNSNSSYRSFVLDHFEWAVCENETKWGSNESTRDVENYTQADYMYNWCRPKRYYYARPLHFLGRGKLPDAELGTVSGL